MFDGYLLVTCGSIIWPIEFLFQVSLCVSCIRDVLAKFGLHAVLLERGFNSIDFYCVPTDCPSLESTLLSVTGSF